MSKWKDREGPKKLTDFFPPAAGRGIQDGTRAENRNPAHAAGSACNPAPSMGESGSEAHPQPPSPFTSSVKQKRRVGKEGDGSDHAGMGSEEMDESSSYGQHLDEFPTSGQPIIDTTMKEMLQTLPGAL